MGIVEHRGGPEASCDVFIGPRGSTGGSRCPSETGKTDGEENSTVAFTHIEDACKHNKNARYKIHTLPIEIGAMGGAEGINVQLKKRATYRPEIIQF